MRVSDGRHVDSDIGYRTTGLTEYGSDDVSIGATEPFDMGAALLEGCWGSA
jgi:hypothetical protein